MNWQPRELTAEQREERRLTGARLLKEGELSEAAIARYLGVHRSSVSRWKHQLEEHHNRLAALKRRRSPGRTPQLTPKQWRQILRWIGNGALKAGFATDRWTLVRIGQLINKRFGVSYSKVYIARKLHQLGYSPQQPVTRALERDDALVEAWLKQDWTRIKKSLAARGRDRLH
jgi:transposase